LAACIALASHLPARAEWSASLPLFKACMPATWPRLPDRWRAVGLMLPLMQGQIDVGEFVYDGALPAMRATVYGLESGAVDILITDKDTYVLQGPHSAPESCVSLGPKLRPPSAQWLTSDSVCVGEAPLATHAVQWWEKPGFDTARYWFSTDSRLPWRTSFVARTLDPAIVGDYAMTFFPTFTPLPATDLTALRDRCAATAKPAAATDIADTPTARELMALGDKAAEAERSTRIGELMPGLGHDACARMTPARWPDRFITTAMVTPIKINDPPYSTLIYYDWNDAVTQLILPFHKNPPVLQGVISLKDRVGYRLHFSPSAPNGGVCVPDLPGVVRPDWMSVDSCKCRGVFGRNSALSPNAESQIMSCPIKMQGQRTMWSWYRTDGAPIMFMEAQPEGSGVMLADYDDWVPGITGQPSDFALPAACKTENSTAVPTFANASCAACHTTPQ
jgi:hypothetical protein